MTELADMITAVTLLLTALGTAIWKLWGVLQERNAARKQAMQAARDEAAAQARLTARTEQAEATVSRLQDEIARKDAALAAKDAALAECTTARLELRQLLLSCRGES